MDLNASIWVQAVRIDNVLNPGMILVVFMRTQLQLYYNNATEPPTSRIALINLKKLLWLWKNLGNVYKDCSSFVAHKTFR